jgi:hypothetical protein
MALENQTGLVEYISLTKFKTFIKMAENIKLVILMACHSQKMGEALLEAGI